MIIVSDTIPLSELAKVEKLNLIHEIYGKIIIFRQNCTELAPIPCFLVMQKLHTSQIIAKFGILSKKSFSLRFI